MTQSTALDKVESMARAIEFLVHFSDKDVWSPEDELAAVCAFAERFDADAIVGYTTNRQPQPRCDLPNGGLSAPTNLALQQAPRRSGHAALCRDLRKGHMRAKDNHMQRHHYRNQFRFNLARRLHGIWPPLGPVCSCIRVRRPTSRHLCNGMRPITAFLRSRHDRVRRVCPTNHPSKALDEGSAGPDKDVPRRAIERHKGRSGN